MNFCLRISATGSSNELDEIATFVIYKADCSLQVGESQIPVDVALKNTEKCVLNIDEPQHVNLPSQTQRYNLNGMNFL